MQIEREGCAPNPSTGRDYQLKRFSAPVGGGETKKPKIVPCRPSSLRNGGGRNDKNGWTKQKLKTCRRNLAALGGINACLSVTMEADKCPSDYEAVNKLLRGLCRRSGLPCVCVWEGPNPHCHIAFGATVSESLENLLKRRLEAFWVETWGSPMGDKAFYLDSAPKPRSTEGYLGKQWKAGKRVKDAFDWLRFCPRWKSKVTRTDRYDSAFSREDSEYKLKHKASVQDAQVLTDSPSITSARFDALSIDFPSLITKGTEGVAASVALLDGKAVCEVCWRKWGRCLKVGCCICTGHVRH